jgi:two-component system, sensor histidine kinase PdtaS
LKSCGKCLLSFEQKVEPIDLDISQAIPLGLIINESVVNAIKYAFPAGTKSTISIALVLERPDHVLLTISDNGIGLPKGLDISKHKSLGLDLMQGLTKQLKGTFMVKNGNGVHIIVRFVIKKTDFRQLQLKPLKNQSL